MFNCLPHDLHIAKLDGCGFKNDALYLVFEYLNNRKQRVNSSFSSFQNIISGVPQGSLLFNIFLTEIFLFCPTEIASYADDSTPYATGNCLKKLCKK